MNDEQRQAELDSLQWQIEGRLRPRESMENPGPQDARRKHNLSRIPRGVPLKRLSPREAGDSDGRWQSSGRRLRIPQGVQRVCCVLLFIRSYVAVRVVDIFRLGTSLRRGLSR